MIAAGSSRDTEDRRELDLDELLLTGAAEVPGPANGDRGIGCALQVGMLLGLFMGAGGCWAFLVLVHAL